MHQHRAQASTDPAKAHFNLFFTSNQLKENIVFRAQAEKALCDTLMQVALSGLLSTTTISQLECRISSKTISVTILYKVKRTTIQYNNFCFNTMVITSWKVELF